jgi:uncharacterized protein YwgA
MEKKDWTLIVVAAAGDRPLQPAHLQKALFLLDRNLTTTDLTVDTFYDFQAYDYGPFCSEIYWDAEGLEREGMLHIDVPHNLSYRLYSATESGKERARVLRENLRTEAQNYLDALVKWVQSQSFRNLVSTIYRNYPDMRVNSVFQE